MKKYVIFSSYIGGVGGGQMYARNKMLYLREHGWVVDIFSVPVKDIRIKELQEFESNCFLPIFPMYSYRNKNKDSILGSLKDKIVDRTNYEDIVIESNSIHLGLWAEALSQMLGCKHLAYPLDEKLVVENNGLQKYVIFKHRRRELAGIQNTSLSKMFSSFAPISPESSYRLLAWANNAEADVDNHFIHEIDENRYDYVVGVLSRLNKKFVLPAIEDFCHYAALHKDLRFLLLLIGDSANNDAVTKTILAKMEMAEENVECIVTGYLYPIPTRLLEKCDVFMASAGCVSICSRSGVPTICYDGCDGEPIGVFGKTTRNNVYRGENEPPLELSSLLDTILINKVYKKEEPSYYEGTPDFSEHISFLANSEQEHSYFDVSSIKAETTKEKMQRFLISVTGETMCKKLLLKIAKLKNRI